MNDFIYNAEIKFRREDAKSLEVAMDKEVSIKDRANATLHREGKEIVIKIKAKDASSFRATLNSYLRIIQSTENIDV